MTKYTQKEWLDMLDRASYGKWKYSYDSAFVGRKGNVVSVGISGSSVSGGSFSGGITANEVYVACAGRREFAFDEDGAVSLYVGDGNTPKYAFPDRSKAFVNRCVIPFVKWLDDYVGVVREMKRGDFKDCRVDYAVVRDGIVKGMFVTGKDGQYGYSIAHEVSPNDILTFTYGLARNDLSSWGDSSLGYGTTATFNSAFDLVYDADETKYYHNAGYHGDFFERGKRLSEASLRECLEKFAPDEGVA